MGAEDDRAIWPLVIEVVRRVKPRWAVFENVYGIINMALDGVLSDLEAEGYEVGTVVIPACAVNAPHRRDRVWIVAHRKGEFGDERFDGSGVEENRKIWNGRKAGTVRQDVADVARDTDRDRQSALPVHAEMEVMRGAVAHPSIRPDQQSQPQSSLWPVSGRDEEGDGDVSDAYRPRRIEQRWPVTVSEKQFAAKCNRSCDFCGYEFDRDKLGKYGCPNCCGEGLNSGQLESRLDRNFARLPSGLDRPDGSGPEFWDGDWERGIPRVATGVKDRAKRLKSLGNSIVPQVAYQIFRAIEDTRP